MIWILKILKSRVMDLDMNGFAWSDILWSHAKIGKIKYTSSQIVGKSM